MENKRVIEELQWAVGNLVSPPNLQEALTKAIAVLERVGDVEGLEKVIMPIYMKEINVVPKYAKAISNYLINGEGRD